MWEAIQYVSSALTLVAFLAAVGAWIYKARVDAREKLITAAREEQRAELIARTLEYFEVDTSGLTKDQKYQLALTQIHARSRRYQQTAIVICFLAVVLATLSGYAISQGKPAPPTQQTAVGSSEEIASEAIRRINSISTLANSAQNYLKNVKRDGRPFMVFRDDLRELSEKLALLWRTTASYGIFSEPYPHAIKVSGSSGPGPRLPEGSKYPLDGVPQLRIKFLKSKRIAQLSDDRFSAILAKYKDPGTFPFMDFTFQVYESGTAAGQRSPPDFSPYLNQIDRWLGTFKEDVSYVENIFKEPNHWQ